MPGKRGNRLSGSRYPCFRFPDKPGVDPRNSSEHRDSFQRSSILLASSQVAKQHGLVPSRSAHGPLCDCGCVERPYAECRQVPLTPRAYRRIRLSVLYALGLAVRPWLGSRLSPSQHAVAVWVRDYSVDSSSAVFSLPMAFTAWPRPTHQCRATSPERHLTLNVLGATFPVTRLTVHLTRAGSSLNGRGKFLDGDE
jgi:hypothetical protein